MIFTSSKLPVISESIFTKMTQMALEYNAINLSQGFPDFETDPKLIEWVYKAMKDGHNQYAPAAGVPELRAYIAQKMAQLHGAHYDEEQEVTVTAGASEAIFSAITALVHAGDEVIIFDPSYDLYAPTVTLMGGTVRALELNAKENFNIDWEKFKKLFNVRTKMIIINSPHNPSGCILKLHDIQQLIKLTSNTDVIIISDEVYEHMVYDQKEHLSLARFPELRERSIITASFGKITHTTGWKVGYCVAPAALMKEFRKVHQYNVFCVSTPIQYALANYFNENPDLKPLTSFFEEKRNYFQQLLKDTPFKILPCEGSYFQCISFEHLSDEKDTDIAKLLTIKYGVASIPLSVFYSKNTDPKILRLCFAKSNETLEKAAERLRSFKI